MENLKLLPTIEHGQTPKKPSRKNLLKSRVYAFIIDIYAIVFLAKGASIAWSMFVREYISNFSFFDSSAWAAMNVNTFALTLPIFYTAYFFFFLYLNEGRTLGKMAQKLKVCAKHDHKRELTFMEAFSRSIAYLFCNYLSYLPFLINFGRKDSMGIAELISNTVTLREDEIAIIESQEEHVPAITPENQIELFPEDPVSIRISKAA